LSNSDFYIVLKNVLYAPDIRKNLISVNQLTEKDLKVSFGSKRCEISTRDGDVILTAIRSPSGLYKMENLMTQSGSYYARREDFENSKVSSQYYATKGTPDIKIWHKRLGHISHATVKDLKLKKLIDAKDVTEEFCEECQLGKNSRQKFPNSNSKSKAPLELVHSDIAGPLRNTKTLQGEKYFLTFMDDYSGYCTVYLMKDRKNVLEYFRDFKVLMETQTEHKLKKLRTDNGSEYVSTKFKEFCRSSGIIQELTVPYTPQN
jgi:hypothetical protein